MAEPQYKPAQAPESTVIRGDGVELACFVSGPADAPTLVFVHGYPDNHSVWDRLIAQLESDYRCVRYDVRGAGASSKPRRTASYELAHLAADLEAVLRWASPKAPVHLIGHDWGSIQAWEAVTDPTLADRIASFTSISGPCLDHVGHWLRAQWHNDRSGLLGQLRKSWYIAAFHIPVVPGVLWRHVLGPRWPVIARRLEGEALPTTATQGEDGAIGIRLYRANILKRLRTPRERHAQAPVHVIVPQRDPFVGPGFTRGLDRWVKTLTVTRVDGAHWAIHSQPREIAAACRDFIARQKEPAHARKAPTRRRHTSKHVSPETGGGLS